MRHRGHLMMGIGALVGSAASPPVAAAPPPAPAGVEGPAVERRLHLADAEASSYLVNDWNKFQENYLPLYTGDGDPRTAWTHGTKTDGVGEWLRFKVTPLKGATRVRMRVRNGYQKTPKLFAANGRARAVTVVLLPSGKTTDVELADKEGWQEVVASQPDGPLDGVELRFRSVYPGKKYTDLCISDVELLVTATTPDNPAFEKARLTQLLGWKADRVAAAKLFKSNAGKTMPVAPQYAAIGDFVLDERMKKFREESCGRASDPLCMMRNEVRRAQFLADGDQKAASPALVRAGAIVDAGPARMAPVQVVAEDKRRIPVVDGLCVRKLSYCEEEPCYKALPMPLTGQMAFMNATQLSTLDLKDGPSLADVASGKPKECGRREPKTWAWALRGAPAAAGSAGPLEALLLASCGTIDTREGHAVASAVQLLVYGGDGKLELVGDNSSVATLRWRSDSAGGGGVLASGWVAQSWGGLQVAESVSVASR
jgi:hypothetical protein